MLVEPCPHGVADDAVDWLPVVAGEVLQPLPVLAEPDSDGHFAVAVVHYRVSIHTRS